MSMYVIGVLATVVVVFVVRPYLRHVARMREVRLAATRGHELGYPEHLVTLATKIIVARRANLVGISGAREEAEANMVEFFLLLDAWRHIRRMN